jgi:hypothetical protein
MSPNWFSSNPWRQKRSTHLRQRRITNLSLEALEDRLLLNNRFVMPGTPDTATNFATLQAALTTPGLAAGDVIQINAGSNPGHIKNANIPQIANLTIQGDPTADLGSVPVLALDDSLGITQPGFTLKHVQVDILNGTLEFTANCLITGCFIKSEIDGPSVSLVNTTASTISDSTIENDFTTAAATTLVAVEPAAGSHNQVIDNHFLSETNTNVTLLKYKGRADGADLVAHNSFTQKVGIGIDVQPSTDGLTIQSNTFLDDDLFGTAINISPAKNQKIVDNSISVPDGNASSCGIVLMPSQQAALSNLVIAVNHIHTNGKGTGIEVSGQQLGLKMAVRIEGNDLQDNGQGVLFFGAQGGAVTDVDLGGGTQGSRGANDFRGDLLAIQVTAAADAGPITAQSNIYSVAEPKIIIHDGNKDATLATVDSSSPMLGNAAYVETMYVDFLHRTGDLSKPGDAGYWVGLLGNQVPAATVAAGIVHSTEGLGLAVDGLYHEILGRDADSAGRIYFVSYLLGGGTAEGVSQSLFASPDYKALYPSDSSFAQSLYQTLLRRAGSNAEVSQATTQAAQIGCGGVAEEFLFSQEYRGQQVADDYASLLHRPAPVTAAEVSFWAAGGLDLLALDAVFAGTQEFQQNG